MGFKSCGAVSYDGFCRRYSQKIGRIKADQIAKATSRTLSAFNSLMKPLTLSMKGVSTLVERGFDLKQTEEQVSIDHLLYDLSDAAEHGTLKPELSQMCRGILTMMRATAREIATRTIFSFTSETPVKEVYAGIQKEGLAAFPSCNRIAWIRNEPSFRWGMFEQTDSCSSAGGS